MIDAISDQTLEYSPNGGLAIGGFTWSMHFDWHPIYERVQEKRKSSTDVIRYHMYTIVQCTIHYCGHVHSVCYTSSLGFCLAYLGFATLYTAISPRLILVECNFFFWIKPTCTCTCITCYSRHSRRVHMF